MAGAMTLASCANDDDFAGSPSKSSELKVVAGINGVQTRAFDNQWNVGDEIGLFAVKTGTSDLAATANLEYRSANTETSTESNFLPVADAVSLPEEGAVDVVSYYPYSTSAAGGVLSLNLADQSNQAAIDLLAAKAEGVSQDNSTAVLNFKHKLTKVFIKATTDDGSSLDDLTATLGGQYTSLSYDVLGDKLALGEGATTSTLEMRSATAEGYRYVEAIVLPNTVEGNPAATRNLEFTHNGKVYKAAISDAVSFEPGTKYVINATFSTESVKIEGAGITNWVEQPGSDIVVVPGGDAEFQFGYANVYAFGDATPNGWNMGDGPQKFTKVDNHTFTLTVALKAGEMKFPLNNDWGCDWIMPTIADAPLSHTACEVVKDGADHDYKWKLTDEDAGTYDIVLDVQAMTMTATKVEE